MTLSLGTKLGPYEILAPLGAGGMGEVYRARDPRLGRDVAVKVLPRAVSGDPERQQRFEGEARAVGALNHPNIVTMYDVGVEGGVPYLVTEVLEGESLRALLGRGPLPARRAVQIVVQVARGLSAAHAKGIVHRDLKPENLFVLPDGRVKILDFGIAKLTTGATTATAETTPVFASMTAAGTIMGTVSYMAPEQLRDQAVDHRADLFALGVILHELLTGTQPFGGDTAADRVSAILMADPPALTPEVEAAIPGMGAMIAHLLAKRPEARLESAADLAFTLELLARRPALAAAAGAAGAGADADAGPGAATSAGAGVSFRSLTFRDGVLYRALFTPDGQTFVYQAAFAGQPSEIFLARLESPDARPIGLGNADLQAVSPSAELAVTLGPRDIGGFVRLGMLARVPLVGGRPREIAEDVFQADWFAGGKSLAAIRKVGTAFQIEAPIGTIIHKTNSGWLSNLRTSPDGSLFAFLDHPMSGSNGGYACVIRPGEAVRRLSKDMPTISNLAWRPDGEEIWFSAQGVNAPDGIYAVNLKGDQRHVYSAPGYTALQDIAANGDALLAMLTPRMRMETSTRTGGPAEATDLSWLDWTLLRDLGSDGSTVLFDETGPASGGSDGVYVRSISGEPAIRLGDGVAGGISPDGRFVVGGELGGYRFITILPVGAGQARRVTTEGIVPSHGFWLSSGREVVVAATAPGQGARLYRVNIESGAYAPLSDEIVQAGTAIPSPDGTNVLTRGEDACPVLLPVEGGAPRRFPNLDSHWRLSSWTGDSKSFFTFRSGAVPAKVLRVDASTGETEPWMEIMPTERSGVSGLNSVRFTQDGERYVCSYMRINAPLFHARGLR